GRHLIGVGHDQDVGEVHGRGTAVDEHLSGAGHGFGDVVLHADDVGRSVGTAQRGPHATYPGTASRKRRRVPSGSALPGRAAKTSDTPRSSSRWTPAATSPGVPARAVSPASQ